MTGTLRQIALLAAKDLRIECRTRQSLPLVTMLGLLIIVVLGLAMGSLGRVDGAQATAILWVAYLFGGVLCFEKTMALERQDGALSGLLLAPVDRGVLFAGKLLSNLLLMLALAGVITAAAVVLFGFDLASAPGGFAAVTGLGLLGFAAVGTLFAAAVSATRQAGGLLAMVVLPVCLPLVVVSTQLMIRLFRDGQPMGGEGLGVLLAFDAVYLVAGWLVYERALQP